MIARRAGLVLAILAASFALPAVANATTPGVNGRIVFSSNRDGTSNDELYSVAADGTTVTRLTWSLTVEQSPAWSPDGSKIAFESFAEGGGSIHVMDADGSNERRVSPEGSGGGDDEPAWSPDGSRIAFSSTRSGSWNVWVMNTDGSGARRLVSEFSVAPAWSPDGSRIAFLNMAGAISVADADGTGARQLTFPPSAHVDERPSWSPDAGKLVFARRSTYGNDPQLYVVDADGSNERQLTFGDGVSRFPTWSPDGTQIVFTHDQHVSVIGSDGSGMRQLLTSAGRDLGTDWGTSTAVPGPRPPGPPTIGIYSPANRLYGAGEDVYAVFFCESATSFVISCEGDVPFGTLLDMETTGLRTFTVRATDLDGRTSTKTVNFEVFDWRAPTVVVHTPADGAEYELGESVEVAYECVDEQGGSGIEFCDGDLQQGQPLRTEELGSFTFQFWAVDRAHNVTFASVTYSVVDRTPPTITVASPQEGAVYVLGETVLASFGCADKPGSGIGSCLGTVQKGAPLDTSSVGTKSFTVTAEDIAHNVSFASVTYSVVDRPLPTATIETPQEGAVYVLGETVLASFRCDDAVSCRGNVESGALLETSSIGAKSFTVTAKDLLHRFSTLTRHYRVVYPFSGFFSPLEAFPAKASRKAGETVPAKFSLAGDRGLGVVAGSTWTRVDCQSGAPLGDSSTAAGRLSFHSGRYQLLVETDASWAGSCRQLAVTLDDGTTHLANISFG